MLVTKLSSKYFKRCLYVTAIDNALIGCVKWDQKSIWLQNLNFEGYDNIYVEVTFAYWSGQMFPNSVDLEFQWCIIIRQTVFRIREKSPYHMVHMIWCNGLFRKTRPSSLRVIRCALVQVQPVGHSTRWKVTTGQPLNELGPISIINI